MTTGNGTGIHDVLPPYAPVGKRPKSDGEPRIGQLLCTIVPEWQPPLNIFDAQRADQSTHGSVNGTIRPVDAKIDYRHKAARLPVFKVGLGDCEELLALRSKVRPCVVIATADGIPDKHLPPQEQGRARPAFQRPSYLVAPAYSVSTPQDPRAMTATIAARAECLVYPHLLYLPTSGGCIRNPSVVRLDRAFWTALPPPSELYELSLSDERLAILHGQILVLQGFDPGAHYIEIVELARSVLDPKFEMLIP